MEDSKLKEILQISEDYFLIVRKLRQIIYPDPKKVPQQSTPPWRNTTAPTIFRTRKIRVERPARSSPLPTPPPIGHSSRSAPPRPSVAAARPHTHNPAPARTQSPAHPHIRAPIRLNTQTNTTTSSHQQRQQHSSTIKCIARARSRITQEGLQSAAASRHTEALHCLCPPRFAKCPQRRNMRDPPFGASTPSSSSRTAIDTPFAARHAQCGIAAVTMPTGTAQAEPFAVFFATCQEV